MPIEAPSKAVAARIADGIQTNYFTNTIPVPQWHESGEVKTRFAIFDDQDDEGLTAFMSMTTNGYNAPEIRSKISVVLTWDEMITPYGQLGRMVAIHQARQQAQREHEAAMPTAERS